MAAPQYMHKLELSFDPSKIEGYYVYIFSHNDVPFYVGLGKNSRWRQHFHNSPFREGHNSYRYSKIRKLLDNDDEKIQVHIAAHRLSAEEAQQLEMKLIAEHGRKCDGGTLTNISIGGESGANGRKHTEEHKQYMSVKQRGTNSKVTEDLVYKAKLLYHYRGMKPKDIVELPEYSHLSKECISNWISKSNPNYSYLAPHLKCEKELWDEKREEAINLWETGRWNYTQIGGILGLDRCFVSRACRGVKE